jgi:hypothetical protein
MVGSSPTTTDTRRQRDQDRESKLAPSAITHLLGVLCASVVKYSPELVLPSHSSEEIQLPAHLLDSEREAAARAGVQHGIG